MDIYGFIINYLRHQTVRQLRRSGAIIGENVSLNSSTIDYHSASLIEIGNNVTITTSIVLAHDASTKNALGYTKIAKTIIGNNVFIGAGSVVLPGSRIGNNTIIAAGTVVKGVIPDNSVFAGNPGRVVCSYDEYISKNKERMKSALIIKKPLSDMNRKEKDSVNKKIGDYFGFEP